MKHWKLTVLAILLIALLSALGYWQINRAHQKEALFSAFNAHIASDPLPAKHLTTAEDLRFYRVQLKGHFDNAHTYLLDNTIYQGKVGYEVYTPFIAHDVKLPILIDRGFIPMGAGRQIIPAPRAITGEITLIGMLNLPPRYKALGDIRDRTSNTWPMRIEFINLQIISQQLPYALYPYLVQMDPKDLRAYPLEWVVTLMSPKRHYAYAFQWFALALALLIIWVTLKCKTT